ncbi:MAG: glycosyltransferase family 4 protein [Desulfobacterales bacterium]|jgi:UDP-glucose:(heptosyl)LPS alpha-1,3-glucosyltransferase
MKFAFTLIKYFPFGGLQRDFIRIAETCLARGHRVDVFTPYWQGEVPAGLNVTVLKLKAISNHQRRLALAREVRRETRHNHYDAVVGFSKMPGLDYYYAADSCFVDRLPSKPFWYPYTGRCRSYRALEEAVFAPQSSTQILLLTEIDRQIYQHYYQTPSDRFHVLPPGIARDRLAPSDTGEIRRQLRHELGLGAQSPMILMVGSGFRTKGTDRAMMAFAALPETLRRQAALVIIGRDNFRPFRRLAQRLGIAPQVIFFPGRDDIPRFLFSADILLHPAYRENTGTVLIEAMAARLPVLATDVCGYADHVARADAGQLIPTPFRQATLNRMLADMLIAPHREVWGANGRRYVTQNDVFSMPEKAADILEGHPHAQIG